MDSKHRFYTHIFGSLGIKQVLIHGNKRRLPIVTMDNIGFKINKGDNLQNGTREESKSFGVVVMAVKRTAFKIILVVDKIIN